MLGELIAKFTYLKDRTPLGKQMSSPGRYIQGRNLLLPTIFDWLTSHSWGKMDYMEEKHWSEVTEPIAPNLLLFRFNLDLISHRQPPAPSPGHFFTGPKSLQVLLSPLCGQLGHGLCHCQQCRGWWRGRWRITASPGQPPALWTALSRTVAFDGPGLLSSVNTSEIPAGSSTVLMFYKEKSESAKTNLMNQWYKHYDWKMPRRLSPPHGFPDRATCPTLWLV